MRKRFCKIILTFLLAALCLASLFAYDNTQKIYPVGDEVYEAIKYIYLLEGKALPSYSGPWSLAELKIMMGKINRPSLGEQARNTYDWAMEKLGQEPKNTKHKNLGVSLGVQINPEFYAHTNTEQAFQGRDSWAFGYMKQAQFFNFTWETWAAKHFYGYFELPIRNNYQLATPFGSAHFSWDFPGISSFKPQMLDVDANVPYRAFFSLGGENWNIQAGRDRLSWGAGESGNMAVSDNIPYHNQARFTTFFENFKFTFLASFFPHPMNYDEKSPGRVGKKWGHGSQGDEDRGLKFYMAHRIEGRLFKDKLGLSLTEAIMYISEDGHADIRVLNPMAFFHNYYIRRNSNSTLTLEADWTLARGFNLYAQYIIDEFNLPNEGKGPYVKSQFPQACGYLAGIKRCFPLGKGIFHSSAEFAYTDPFLYLRYLDNSGENNLPSHKGEYELDYVVALRTFSNCSETEITYYEYFLGYPYGGDAIVLNLNAGWKIFGKLSLEANVFSMLHGTYDKWTRWSEVGTKAGLVKWEDSHTPTVTHKDTVNDKDPEAGLRNSASFTLVAGASLGWDAAKSLRLFLQADFVSISNYANIKGAPKNDFQFVLGLRWAL